MLCRLPAGGLQAVLDPRSGRAGRGCSTRCQPVALWTSATKGLPRTWRPSSPCLMLTANTSSWRRLSAARTPNLTIRRFTVRHFASAFPSCVGSRVWPAGAERGSSFAVTSRAGHWRTSLQLGQQPVTGWWLVLRGRAEQTQSGGCLYPSEPLCRRVWNCLAVDDVYKRLSPEAGVRLAICHDAKSSETRNSVSTGWPVQSFKTLPIALVGSRFADLAQDASRAKRMTCSWE